jgi:hypothetical protein
MLEIAGELKGEAVLLKKLQTDRHLHREINGLHAQLAIFVHPTESALGINRHEAGRQIPHAETDCPNVSDKKCHGHQRKLKILLPAEPAAKPPEGFKRPIGVKGKLRLEIEVVRDSGDRVDHAVIGVLV